MGERDKPDPQSNREMLRAAVQESPTLSAIIKKLRFGEITLKFSDERLVSGYIQETVKF